MQIHENLQPIATAPKDGTRIRVVRTVDNALFEVCWSINENFHHPVETGVWACVDDSGWFEPEEVDYWLPLVEKKTISPLDMAIQIVRQYRYNKDGRLVGGPSKRHHTAALVFLEWYSEQQFGPLEGVDTAHKNGGE